MSLSQFNINVQVLYALQTPNSNFGPNVLNPLVNSFSLNGLNINQWSFFLAQFVQVSPSGGTANVNVNSFTDLQGNACTMQHALGIMIFPTGSDVVLSPGASNPLTWFFGGSTQSVDIPNGGIFVLCNSYGGEGVGVSPSNANLKLTNNGGSPATVYFFVIGSPS
jgi:hypothetical protein